MDAADIPELDPRGRS